MRKFTLYRGQALPKVLEEYFGDWNIHCIDGEIRILKADVYEDDSIDFFGYLISDEGRYRVEGTITPKGSLYYNVL